MRIALIGNYAADRQESMLRYTELLREGLVQAGHDVEVAVPFPVANPHGRPAVGAWKWLGYLDKYLLGTGDISRAVRRADVVHVCDHSNAVYVSRPSDPPHVVTCHDLLAVRGALGEDTDCSPGVGGRYLQKQILEGLGRARAVACVSTATMLDARRLLGDFPGDLVVIPNALNYPYKLLDERTVRQRLARVENLSAGDSYILHVGSNLRRKNREAVLRAVARIATGWSGKLVFAGQPLSVELHALVDSLGLRSRVIEIAKPDNALLEALYNEALALLFPSRFEGFGWPVIEAQACGCPVICSDREPLPEVAGGAAIHCDAEDDEAMGNAVIALAGRTDLRADLRRRGLQNATRYDRSMMIQRFVALYERSLYHA